MIYLFVGYLLAIVASLFIASWRTAIWAIAVESLVAGLIHIRADGFGSWPARIQVLDLVLFRGFVVPLVLISVLKKLKAERDFDTVPANFVIWTMALVVLIVSYWFGQKTFPSDLQSSIHMGTATAGVLTGVFILANQSSTLGQLIGLLTMESGIVMTEVFSAGHEQWFIQLGISLVFIWTITLIWEFLRHFSELEAQQIETAGAPHVEEREVL